MPVWVQLLKDKSIDLRGRLERYHAGDWVQIGTQQAALWIASGEARAIGAERAKLLGDVGVVARRQAPNLSLLEKHGVERVVVSDALERQPWEKTIFWDPALTLRYELLPVGARLLDRWQVAVPIMDYDVLARDVGDPADRANTEQVIRDLRVLLYDTRLIFSRRSTETATLFARWKEERSRGGDERLAFLRALYRTPMLICALPTTWVGKGPR